MTAGSDLVRAETTQLDELSPAFLGMYRKVMEIEPEIRRYSERYGVDFDLARAVCLYESGGNAGLISHAGAQGYFQVMPSTFRELKVSTNIEAGVKYLGQMIEQFGREDRAVAAYNGGPGRVGRAGSLPLETLQYVVGVGHYRTVLKQHDVALRFHASRLHLAIVRAGDDWVGLSRRVGIAEWELRLHNPFLAGRPLRIGERVAYPSEPRTDLLTAVDGGAAYRMRHGDNHIKLAITLGVDVDALRSENGLWQTLTVPAGAVLRLPFSIDRASVIRSALAGPELGAAATARPILPKSTTHSTGVEGRHVAAAIPQQLRRPEPTLVTRSRGATRSASPSAAPALAFVAYRVKRGDTLSTLARRNGTSISAIQRASGLRSVTIHVGQVLRIPRTPLTKDYVPLAPAR